MNIVEKARIFARNAHHGQTRKLSTEPYFVHPEAVAKILLDANLAEEIIAAGYLHDTVEDTNVSIEDIQREFGHEIAEIVAGNTEDKSKTWEERKKHTIEYTRTAAFEMKCLIAADKLDNLQSIANTNSHDGEKWSHFKRGKEKQGWYYKGIADSLFENIQEEIPTYFYTYKSLVNEVFSE
ncbi:HD domain-containing protein [Bacillus salitolerans]|uniref:HD domain-containing protein n=1 Tax=Bacillus salitolerans TaxID=1437434 RepID=A0ABW4LR19_9BACI